MSVGHHGHGHDYSHDTEIAYPYAFFSQVS
jgi:hypothetical protein